MKQERSKVKSDILLRVRLLYVLFILAGAIVLARLVWVQLFSAEVAYNADRLASRIFTEEVIPAQRGSILSRDGEPLATSIFRYQAAFDFASPGLDSLKTFREQADSLAKLLAAFFRDKPASAYAKRFREEHARRYRLVNPRDTSYLRSEGWISRMMDRMRGEEYVKRRIYDTIRDHTPVNIFPREVDFAEWETLRRYPLLNWNMGMVYRLIERDERIYPQGELARRTIGLTGDKGNYGIEEAYREELAGRDGKALRQRIARGFYGRVAGGDHEDPVDGFDIVTTLDLDNLPRTADGKVDFSKDFFGKSTNLTVSGQLNAENFALAFGDVYTFGPTFRAENSNTQRHAAEFWMIEPEMAFADLDDDLECMEAMVKFIINTVLEKCPQEMEFFNSFVDKGLLERLHNVVDNDFGRITYTDAVKLLKESGHKFDYPVEWGIDLQTEHERYLTEQVFNKPVFVTDYPKEIKAFYMRMNDDGKTVAAADCLVPGIGEIIGGSQREERLDLLTKRMQELGLREEDYWWYLDLRRYGSCRHAGFGLGFERMVMYLTGVSNIRDVELHPRTVGNADF